MIIIIMRMLQAFLQGSAAASHVWVLRATVVQVRVTCCVQFCVHSALRTGERRSVGIQRKALPSVLLLLLFQRRNRNYIKP